MAQLSFKSQTKWNIKLYILVVFC